MVSLFTFFLLCLTKRIRKMVMAMIKMTTQRIMAVKLVIMEELKILFLKILYYSLKKGNGLVIVVDGESIAI